MSVRTKPVGEPLVRPGAIVVRLDASVYPEEVIFKCAYWHAESADVDIRKSGDSWEVELRPKIPASDEALAALESTLRRDLVDFRTRQIVHVETRAIREMLVAKAFAATDEFDDLPPGTLTEHANT